MSGGAGSGRWVVPAIALLVGGCVSTEQNGPESEGPDAAGGPGGAAVTIERGACYGTCPIYRLTLHEDGRVVYDGERHVQQTGRATTTIDPAAAAALIAELEGAGFASFADRYAFGETACGRYAADLPAVTLTLERGGVTKRVEHDHGCTGAPPALTALERRVDQVAGSARWVGPR